MRRSLPTSKRAMCSFIDEIHRLNRMVEEILYPALEDFVLDIVVGEGPSCSFVPPRSAAVHASSVLLREQVFSRVLCAIVSASHFVLTTMSLKSSRRSSRDQRVSSMLRSLKMALLRSRVAVVALPRLANRLLKRVRDWAQVKGDSIIDEDCAAQALSFFEVDSLGLDAVDNRILEMLCGQFAGAPWVSPRSLQRSLKCLKRSRMSTSLILCNRGCSFVRRKDVRLHGVLSSTLA